MQQASRKKTLLSAAAINADQKKSELNKQKHD